MQFRPPGMQGFVPQGFPMQGHPQMHPQQMQGGFGFQQPFMGPGFVPQPGPGFQGPPQPGFQAPQQPGPAIPPKPAPPPDDADAKTTIDRAAAYCTKNGPAFEEMTRAKQAGNPKFAFLSGGAGSEYYRWRIWCLQNRWSDEQIEQQIASMKPAAAAGTTAENLGAASAAEAKEFRDLLAKLTGSKDSIRQTKSWVVGHEHCIGFVSSELCKKVEGANDFKTRLNHLYLINDILHHCMKVRGETGGMDPITSSLQRRMVEILTPTWRGETEANQTKVEKVLKLWGDRSIFDTSTLASITADMKGEKRPEPAAPPMAAFIPRRYRPTNKQTDIRFTQRTRNTATRTDIHAHREIQHDAHRERERERARSSSPQRRLVCELCAANLAVGLGHAGCFQTHGDVPTGIIAELIVKQRRNGAPVYTSIAPELCPAKAPDNPPCSDLTMSRLNEFYYNLERRRGFNRA